MAWLLRAVIAAACLASAVSIAGAQTRFDVVDDHGIERVPGLRIITIHDALLKSCYLVFLSDPAPGVHAHGGAAAVDVNQARAARDQRLGDLLRAYDQDRSAIPGTIIPNPLKYDWQADATEVEFALLALQQQFARLEQQIDVLIDASRTALTAMPVACVPPASRPSQ